ncbi:protein-tyrosine phosphatase [Balamuthia mandrillaris]
MATQPGPGLPPQSPRRHPNAPALPSPLAKSVVGTTVLVEDSPSAPDEVPSSPSPSSSGSAASLPCVPAAASVPTSPASGTAGFSPRQRKAKSNSGSSLTDLKHDSRGVILNSPNELLVGELILKTIKAFDTKTQLLGDLLITTFRLLFNPDDKDVKTSHRVRIFVQGLSRVTQADRRDRNKSQHIQSPKGFHFLLTLKCKDMRTVTFALDTTKGAHLDFFNQVLRRAYPSNPSEFFAFQFRPYFRDPKGWSLFNPLNEFGRQGVLNPCSQWRISYANADYSLCNTYPKFMVIPKEMTDEELIEVGKFRSKARIPVLSWKHPYHQASITRSSQPKVGMTRSRCVADEKLVGAIHRTNPEPCPLYILDARPKVNAMANTATGAGWENGKFYKNCEFTFLGIGNIHVMRDSLKKLREACQDPDDARWHSNLEASGWMENLKLILSSANLMVEIVEKQRASILCHCSDGWDRTAQLTSLAMLMLDPYFRTLEGFIILLEKEWFSFGHNFNKRTGHGDANYKNDQHSPVFLQFLDCVYQLLVQFPCSFEFNSQLLVFLLDCLFSCQYGNYLFDNVKQREEHAVYHKTTSMWCYVMHNVGEFVNLWYDKEKERGEHLILVPNVSRARLRFWSEYYLRYNWDCSSGVLQVAQRHPCDQYHNFTLATRNTAVLQRLTEQQRKQARRKARSGSNGIALATNNAPSSSVADGDGAISEPASPRTDHLSLKGSYSSPSSSSSSLSSSPEKELHVGKVDSPSPRAASPRGLKGDAGQDLNKNHDNAETEIEDGSLRHGILVDAEQAITSTSTTNALE